MVDADLFGTNAELVGAGVSDAGRPRLPNHLMVALLWLKLAFNESDEYVVQRQAQDVYFQFFSSQVCFEPRLPCDDSQIGCFRQVLGKAGVEQLLKTTNEVTVEMGAVKRAEFEWVIVDTTIQEKAVAHPSESRMREVARKITEQTQAGLNGSTGFGTSCGSDLTTRKNDMHCTPGGRVHRLGQGLPALRVRCQGQQGRHPQERLGRRRAQFPRQPLRRPHAGRPDRADHHAAAGHRREAHDGRGRSGQGSDGDPPHALLCARGFNLRWMRRAIARDGIAVLLFVRFVVALLQQRMLRTAEAVPSSQCDWTGSVASQAVEQQAE